MVFISFRNGEMKFHHCFPPGKFFLCSPHRKVIHCCPPPT